MSKTHERLVKAMMIGLLCGVAGGCGSQVRDTLNGNVNLQGDMWWIQSKLFAEDKIFYCPAPAAGNPGPARCQEAKMVDTPQPPVSAK